MLVLGYSISIGTVGLYTDDDDDRILKCGIRELGMEEREMRQEEPRKWLAALVSTVSFVT
jgi:hypothetical protein